MATRDYLRGELEKLSVQIQDALDGQAPSDSSRRPERRRPDKAGREKRDNHRVGDGRLRGPASG